MKKLHILLLFLGLQLNFIYTAQEEKSTDIVHQKSLLSFLPQTARQSAIAPPVRCTDYEYFDRWQNIPTVENISQKSTKNDVPIHEDKVSKKIADKIGLLDDTKSLQENFIHAVHNQQYKRVTTCLALEQYFNKRQKNSSDKEPEESLMQHTETNVELQVKTQYMMCNDPEFLLLVIQDNKIHQAKASDWRYSYDYLLYLACSSEGAFNSFDYQFKPLNMAVIQILINVIINSYENSSSCFTNKLHNLCTEFIYNSRHITTSQKINVLQKLLLAGADMSIECDYGPTPLNIAKMHGENEVAAFLENFTMPTPVPEVITFENEESFRMYMKNKSNSSN